MPKAVKIIFMIILVFTIGLLSLCGIGFTLIKRMLPKTQGEVLVSGPAKAVSIYRDDYHVPHIIAGSQLDAYFAQGYATAQDRLWQMDLWKRAAGGSLSRVLGSRMLKEDSLARTLGFREMARTSLADLDAPSRERIDAYVKGINAQVEAVHGRLPMEFMALGYVPRPWTAEDCLMLMHWTGWLLSPDWSQDLLLAQVWRALGDATTQELLPSLRLARNPLSAQDIPQMDVSRLPGLPMLMGSSTWALGSDKSPNGRPMVASSLHMELDLPGFWYAAHLSAPGMNVYGLTIPGIPGVLNGFTTSTAWGLGSSRSNQGDFVLCPPGTSFEIRTENIDLPRDSVHSMKVFHSQGHPRVNGVLGLPPEPALIFRWAGRSLKSFPAAVHALNTAGNSTAIARAARQWDWAAFDIVYADTTGSVHKSSMGRAMKSDAVSTPIGRNTQSAVIPTEAEPFSSRDFIIAGYDRTTALSPSSSGALRMAALLGDTALTPIQIRRFIDDRQSPWAAQMAAAMAPEIDIHRLADTSSAGILRGWESWQGEMMPGSREAALFQVFVSKFLEKVLEPHMDEDLMNRFITTPYWSREAFSSLITTTDSRLIEGSGRSRRALIHSALDSSMIWLRKHLGDDSNWTLGNVQSLVLVHPMGENPLFAPTFNLGPVTMAGSPTVPSAIHQSEGKIRAADAFRMFCDLDNSLRNGLVLPAGQSGHVIHPAYRDQFPIYSNRQFHSCILDTQRVINSGWDKLILQPGKAHDITE